MLLSACNNHWKALEEGWFEVWLGRNAAEKVTGGRVYVDGGSL